MSSQIEWLKKVKQDWKEIYNVPKEYKTFEISLEAYRQNAKAINAIPKKYKEKLDTYVENYNGFSLNTNGSFKNTSKSDLERITKDLFERSAKRNPVSVYCPPQKSSVQTKTKKNPQKRQSWLSCVKRNWKMIYKVPHQELTEEICILAISQDDRAVNAIPKKIRMSKSFQRSWNEIKNSESKQKVRSPRYVLENTDPICSYDRWEQNRALIFSNLI